MMLVKITYDGTHKKLS